MQIEWWRKLDCWKNRRLGKGLKRSTRIGYERITNWIGGHFMHGVRYVKRCLVGVAKEKHGGGLSVHEKP